MRATTKHGTLTVDEIAEMQPGMARLMDELARRYWTLYYAAEAGNWGLAGYMEEEAEKLLRTTAVVRPKYAEDLATFTKDHLEPIAKSIEAKDWTAFASAYHRGIAASDTLHEKYNKGFIRFRLPDRPPEWFDLEPR